MGGTCSRVAETTCVGEGYNCEGLQKCFTCEATGIGDNAGMFHTKCYVPSDHLFLIIFLPLMIFFSVVGVLYLNRSRIKQAANIDQCCQSMDSRQWSMVVLYLCFELTLIADIYFFVNIRVGQPDKGGESFILGIVFLIAAISFICCYCCKFICCQGDRKEEFYGSGSS